MRMRKSVVKMEVKVHELCLFIHLVFKVSRHYRDRRQDVVPEMEGK